MHETTVNEKAELSTPCASSKLWNLPSAFTLALILAAATLLRFFHLAHKPLWFDECFSVEVARLPWRGFARLLWRREANMSLYYLLLRGWLHFGSSPFFIRSMSAIFSLATVPALFWLASKLFNRRVGLIAAALMAFNAYHIRYAQEARSYSLFVLLATLSSGFFVAELREHSRRNRVGHIITSVLAVYGHLYALWLIAAQWLSVRPIKRPARENAALGLRTAWIWIGSGSLPLVIFAAKTGAGPIRWIHRPGFHDLLEFLEHLSGNDGLILLLLYVAACGFAIIPLAESRQALTQRHQDAWNYRFLVIWLVLPVVMTILLSLVRPLFLGRYFIFCLPPLVILAAAGLARLRLPIVQAASLAVMLMLSLHGTFSYYDHDFDLERDDSQSAVNYVLDYARPGDVILFHIAEARIPYEFFKSIRSISTGVAPDVIYPRHGDRLDDRDFTGKPSRELLESVGRDYTRVWVVLMSNEDAGHPDATTLLISNVMGAAFPQVQEQEFSRVEVRLYSRTVAQPETKRSSERN